MLTLTKPVIAAVHGHCNGGGLEQALAADLRVCTEDAHFGSGEVRLGWIPGGYATQRLPRVIPLGPALEMLYTGGRIDAPDAYRLGLVNQVVPENQLMAKSEAIAEEILKKRSVGRPEDEDRRHAGARYAADPGRQARERVCSIFLMRTEDSKEGALAFAEKTRTELERHNNQ